MFRYGLNCVVFRNFKDKVGENTELLLLGIQTVASDAISNKWCAIDDDQHKQRFVEQKLM